MRAAFIAFSMYSRIPMPMFEWKEEDMKYAMCFFPAAFAIVMQITPMVAAVPNAVPVRTDTRQFKRNAIKIITDGFISPAQ